MEARIILRKRRPLFMTQLALGDASAVVSAQGAHPRSRTGRRFIELRPGAGRREKHGLTSKSARKEQKEMAKLKAAAQDPLLRRLVTVHILATAVSPDYYYDRRFEEGGSKPFCTLVQHH